MRIVKLTPKANDDLTANWDYGQLHFGKAQAEIIIIRILGQSQDVNRHLHWQ